MEFFQILGIVEVCKMLLKILVKKEIAIGPRCLSIIGQILSGPRALEFLDCLMAEATCSVLKVVGEIGFRLRIWRLILRCC